MRLEGGTMDHITLRTGIAAALMGASALAAAGCNFEEQRALAEERERGVNQLPPRGAEPTFAYSRDLAPRAGAGETPMTVAAAGALADTVQSIADARCARQEQCNGVSPESASGRREACASSLRDKVTADLNLSACPAGVDHAALQACLAEIRQDSCNNPVEAVTGLRACGPSDICTPER
jgi:hypothetical protein